MYKKQSTGWFKHYDFIFIDLICLHLAFFLSYFLYQNGLGQLFKPGFARAMHPFIPYADPLYRNMAIFIVLAELVVTLLTGSFRGVLRRRWKKELVIMLRHTLAVFLLATLYLFSTQEADLYSRGTLYLMWVFYFAFLYPAVLLRKHAILHGHSYRGRPSLLVVTTSDLAEDVANHFSTYNFTRVRLCGIAVVDKEMTGEEICGIPVVADRMTVKDYVLHEWVDEIFTCFTGVNEAQKKLVNQFIVMGVTVHEKLNFRAEVMQNKQFVETLANYTVLTTSINYATTLQIALKRLMDVVGGLVGSLITLLLTPIMAIIIWTRSPGRVFFTQDRVGKNGKVFKIIKFRTMYKDAEARKAELMKNNQYEDDMMFKLDFDPRIIGNRMVDGKPHYGIGYKIRKLSLDEFPQFFNVLKGDMSLVGTRPPTLDEWEKYKLHHRARLAIKPGITGMWQVNGRSDIKDFEKVVALDTAYIKNWSVSLDLKILLKTVAVVIKREGSK